MAYPIQLFDFDKDKDAMSEFYKSLDECITQTFGQVLIADKIKKYCKWESVDTPEFLKELATKSMSKILDKNSQTNLENSQTKTIDIINGGKWNGSIGVYGRKVGSVIKKAENILYRIIINAGCLEVYSLEGEGLKEQQILTDGYALLCSPMVIDKIDIKVQHNPIRKDLSRLQPSVRKSVPKIRDRTYMRTTIVLDFVQDST